MHVNARTLLLPALLAGIAPLAVAARPLAAQPDPWRNESLSFESRARDLVSRLTLDEKVSQMKDVAPAIERLGIPAYNWWNEALHGVARSGLATVFPQAIGIAATWNDSLMFRLATVISDEARAKHHEYLRKDSHGRYQGLTFWSPNINIFRDPRWGRGQETFGEDPYLTGRLAVQFIRGLQGNDPRYFKTIATVKHFAVHSGPEPERHSFDAVVSERDLRETYLPQFEMGIREGHAYSLMCAYNRIGGHAACASNPLLKDILRGEWKFPGYIVSDCGAIDDIYLRHKVASTAPAAAAMAVRSGTDLDCGRVYPNLVDAVKQGLITEAEIDTSVTRLFLARFKLGMFDAASHVKWAATPFSVLDQPSHKTLARQVARESIVLLKHRGSVLPLRKDLGTLAVIGPNSDEARMLLGNYNGEPSDPITPLRGIREAVSRTTRVLYARGSDLADNFPVLDSDARGLLTTPDGAPGIRAEFFANRTLTGTPLFTRVDSTARGSWADGSPRADLKPDDFGVRYSGSLKVATSGVYRLGLIGTMKYRLFVDDSLRVRSVYPSRGDEYPDPRLVQSPALQLEAGRSYRVVVEGEESDGDASLQLVMSVPTATLEAEAVRAAQAADAVVMFVGLTARLEGEEMPVEIDGFRGGDRTRIALPAVQQALIDKIAAIGKPLVLVLMSGSAVAIDPNDRVPAILQAWYPGQAGGSAIADVLFGDYNPAGRLPVTFYRSEADLPAFEDYAMRGRTYRYFKGTPLYAFGHGLSYTTFRYGPARVSRALVGQQDSVAVTVDVTNTGTRAGDEVVQLYARHIGSAVERSLRDLRGFRRITLRPGQTQTVRFNVPASSLAYWNSDTHGWQLEKDTIEFEVGASSADIRSRARIQVQGTGSSRDDTSMLLDAHAKARLDSALHQFVASGAVAGASALVFEKGREAYFGAAGMADREASRPISRNTIVQIYSMTKPITGVALMTLYEQGKFTLDDPLSKYAPEFANLQVYDGVDATGAPRLVAPHRPVTIRDLTRHTAGFATSGENPGVGKLLAAADPANRNNTLAQFARKLGTVPLWFHPGERWEYGPSVDVQAFLVERLSGQPFDQYVAQHVLAPLRMRETRYYVPEPDRNRMAAMYRRAPDGTLTRTPDTSAFAFNTRHWPLTPGSAGFTSTLDDYMRFARMLLNEGTLDGVRILRPETVRLMATSHLADSVTSRSWLPSKGRVGFGIDFAVRTRPPLDSTENNGAVGEFFWDGAASTLFWVDPANALAAVLFVQVMPFDGTLHKKFRDAVYGALPRTALH